MAKTTTKPATEATAEVKEEATEATAEVKEKTVKLFLPKTKELQADVYVSVNGRRWQIQRGVEVEVPECVSEVLLHSQKMDLYAMAYEEEASKPKVH